MVRKFLSVSTAKIDPERSGISHLLKRNSEKEKEGKEKKQSDDMEVVPVEEGASPIPNDIREARLLALKLREEMNAIKEVEREMEREAKLKKKEEEEAAKMKEREEKGWRPDLGSTLLRELHIAEFDRIEFIRYRSLFFDSLQFQKL